MERRIKQSKRYDRLKEFEGTKYSGMKIGASHKWYYDQGEWRERKVTPDEWDVYYQTTKRRAGKAPEGSGAPVGTGYNWLIVAHQRVDKLDANSYMTMLDGKKFKVAHKRANKEKWSTTEKTQRKKVIQYLEQVIRELKEADENEFVPYTVGETDRIYGLEHRNITELRAMASELNIPNRSKMNREALQQAIRATKKELKLKPGSLDEMPEALMNKSKEELYRIASDKSIKGRSGMKKEELIEKLEKELETETA